MQDNKTDSLETVGLFCFGDENAVRLPSVNHAHHRHFVVDEMHSADPERSEDDPLRDAISLIRNVLQEAHQ